MSELTTERIGVVGAGTMGNGIAELCARSGLEVTLYEIDPLRIRSARSIIENSLRRRMTKGDLDQESYRAIFERLAFSESTAALNTSTFLFEAITENEEAKIRLFHELERAVSSDAVIASNTSSVPITRLAASLEHPARFVGVHFFNPVDILPLVEITPALMTSDDTMIRSRDLVGHTLGKTIIIAPDQPGFVVNRILIPFLLSAIRMLEQGQLRAEEIDLALEKGCAHPMGPLRLADFIGLDIVKHAAETMYGEYRDPTFAPPILLLRMVDANRLGKKTGQGFYIYES